MSEVIDRPEYGKVVSLSAAGCKYYTFRFYTQCTRNISSSALQLRGGASAVPMHGRGVAIIGCHNSAHNLNYFAANHCCCGIIKIDVHYRIVT